MPMVTITSNVYHILGQQSIDTVQACLTHILYNYTIVHNTDRLGHVSANNMNSIVAHVLMPLYSEHFICKYEYNHVNY